MKKRTVALLMAVVLLFGTVVGGTIAYLTTKSKVVTNTFTVGDINITLDETNTDNDENAEDDVVIDGVERDRANAYKMIPGQKYVKDPIVHVEKGSEPCYVFVKVVETDNTVTGIEGKIIQYAINDGWVDVGDGIYMYGTDANTATVIDALYATTPTVDTVSVLKPLADGTNHITINPDLDKATLDKMDAGTLNEPVLTFEACAIQQANVKVAEAIAQAKAILNA